MEKSDWTKPAVEKLISLYEQHACLYDVKNKFYSNKHARVAAITKIAEQLKIEAQLENITPEDVKKKILNLRSQYNHELSKLKEIKHSGTGSDSVDEAHESTAWWFNHMGFIKQFIKARKGKSNIVESVDSGHLSEASLAGNSQDSQEVVECYDSESMGDSAFSASSSQGESSQLTKRKRNAKEEDQVMASTLVALHDIQQTVKTTLQTSNSKTDEYGKYVARELSEIDDAELLNEAKHEINTILYHFKKRFIDKVKAGVEINYQ